MHSLGRVDWIDFEESRGSLSLSPGVWDGREGTIVAFHDIATIAHHPILQIIDS
jgi:hypothetical protein